ncbi:polysaccharide biosynthesis protein [Candidatus Bipolaricaulota bacterium]|nr:polysaccharide biosynthesis protein [Candidatus Bipolaricaulota bacterium]
MSETGTRRRPQVRANLYGRRLSVILLDGGLIALSMWLAFQLRFDGGVPALFRVVMQHAVLLSVVVKLPVLMLFRVYRFSWRHMGVQEFYNTARACVAGSAALAGLMLALGSVPRWGGVPRSTFGIDVALCLIFLLGMRGVVLMVAHARRGRGRQGARALVVGAGDAGAQLVRALHDDPASGYRVAGLIDDDPVKHGMILHGVRVIGTRDDLAGLIVSREIRAVLLAMPSASPGVVRETVELAKRAGAAEIKSLPSLSQLYTGRISAAELRAVAPEDVLRRTPVTVDGSGIEQFLQGRTVLVTGAAGSIGEEVCRQLLRYGTSRLIGFDFNETGLFYLERGLKMRFPDADLAIEVGDVRDADRVQAVFDRFSPHVVYHAAAYKHVPLMETFPAEAVKANVLGTERILDAACRAGCETFVLISTDKAVNPSSVMGATKRVAELLIHRRKGFSGTRCLAVRFGNVLGSRGSVLRTFREQIEARQPITITHPDMTRYFMLTSEAAQLVLQASVIGTSGQVLVLDMGDPVRIMDLACDMIRFYGLEPDRDIPLVVTGIRPGEKLEERLFSDAETPRKTASERISSAELRVAFPADRLDGAVEGLVRNSLAGDDDAVRRGLQELVPTYEPAGPSEEQEAQSL